ncbi:MAG: hypothetical protein ACP5QH_00030 [Thermoplasmata archaeon]
MGFYDRFVFGWHIVRESISAGWLVVPMLISLAFFSVIAVAFLSLVYSIMFLGSFSVLFFLILVFSVLVLYPLYLLVVSRWVLKRIGVGVKKLTFGRLFLFSMVLYSGNYFISRTEGMLPDPSLSGSALRLAWAYFRYFLPMGFLTAERDSDCVREALTASSRAYQEVALAMFAVRVILALLIVLSVLVVFIVFFFFPSIEVFFAVLGATFIISFIFYYSLDLVVSSKLYAYSRSVDTTVLEDLRQVLKSLEVV